MRVGYVVLLSDVNAPRNDWRKGAGDRSNSIKRRVRADGKSEESDGKRMEPKAYSLRPVHKLVLLLLPSD